MNAKDEITFLWSCILGSKSHINFFGKVLLFPCIITFLVIVTIFIVAVAILDLLFSKSGDL